MPQAVTHVLVALIVASLIRDFFISKKARRKFPLHYVLIAGIAGLLPDIDVAIYWIMYWFGFTFNEVHRIFSHTLLLPIIFLLLAAISLKWKNKELGKHKLKIHIIFLMIAFGIFSHLVLDATLAGNIHPFYPFSAFSIGNDISVYFPEPLNNLFFSCLDAALIVIWLIYLELKHKISDFI